MCAFPNTHCHQNTMPVATKSAFESMLFLIAAPIRAAPWRIDPAFRSRIRPKGHCLRAPIQNRDPVTVHQPAMA